MLLTCNGMRDGAAASAISRRKVPHLRRARGNEREMADFFGKEHQVKEDQENKGARASRVQRVRDAKV